MKTVDIKWFNSFEEREIYFKQHVANLVPQTYLGAPEFWREFNAVKPADVVSQAAKKKAFITSFPQDGLAFSSPMQILRAAAMGQKNALTLEKETAEMFRLAPLMHQALRTLSGGETVRLALAKAYLSANAHVSLSVSAPYSWLDKYSNDLIDITAQTYLAQDKPVEYLALAGEANVTAPEISFDTQCPVFSVSTRNLKIKLSQSFSLGTNPLWAKVVDCDLALQSPCIVLGENGAGKSLLAKALAKVVSFTGQLAVTSGHNNGPCRLLQQNTLAQSLFRTGNQFAPLRQGEVFTEFSEIRNQLSAQNTKSILDVKLNLIAARLCKQPKILILDEPEWGLSFTAAVDFVRATCAIAHSKGIPVMIVSHKTWWQAMANSKISLSKQPCASKDGVFCITPKVL